MNEEQCDHMGCTKEATVYTMCEDHAPESWVRRKEEEEA